MFATRCGWDVQKDNANAGCAAAFANVEAAAASVSWTATLPEDTGTRPCTGPANLPESSPASTGKFVHNTSKRPTMSDAADKSDTKVCLIYWLHCLPWLSSFACGR